MPPYIGAHSNISFAGRQVGTGIMDRIAGARPFTAFPPVRVSALDPLVGAKIATIAGGAFTVATRDTLGNIRIIG